MRSFSGMINQLFNYLDEEIKDNPVFDKYEKQRRNWENSENWLKKDEMFFRLWKVPNVLEEAKSLAYNIYRTLGKIEDNGDKLSYRLYRQRNFQDNIFKLNNSFLGYFAKTLDDIVNANPEIEIEKPKKIEGKTVFIIHGHDNELKQTIQLLLRDAGVENVVLHEQPDRGRTIINKLFEETTSSGYAIALLTPDDITEEGEKRARQNVILELGYFLGKLGHERIRMIIKGNIEIPSDLQGILYERYDDNGAWRIKLLKEIRAVGIYVDLESVLDKF
jgi:predicted nucleotide-binding protein